MTLDPLMAATSAASTAAVNPAPKPAATDPLANKDTFLQLLVAQLKYQNPESPADGTAFVAQLAQFSSLEETTASRQDLDGILKALSAVSSAPAAATSSTTGTPALLS
jgi:flagellar basal-body rod modification protein FlgD